MGFYSPDPSGGGIGQLLRVSVRGGTPLTLCDCYPSWGAAWLPDGTIIVPHSGDLSGAGTTLFGVPETGGALEPLTTIDPAGGEYGHGWPHALPGGTAVLFTILSGTELTTSTAYVEVLGLDTGERHVVLDSGYNARYIPTGHVIFARQGALWGVPFDIDTLETTGPEQVDLRFTKHLSLEPG